MINRSGVAPRHESTDWESREHFSPFAGMPPEAREELEAKSRANRERESSLRSEISDLEKELKLQELESRAAELRRQVR